MSDWLRVQQDRLITVQHRSRPRAGIPSADSLTKLRLAAHRARHFHYFSTIGFTGAPVPPTTFNGAAV